MCINLSGNDRSGKAFDLIWRNGRQFHVYGGSGADHQVVEVGKKAASTTTSGTTTDSTPATDTTSTYTSGGTSASDTSTGTSSTGTSTTPSSSTTTTK